MGLKLSKNKDRLFDFLTNSYIQEDLFVSLLKLYDWQEEGLLENDTNRDICVQIVRRFYNNIEHNHNIEYSPLGIAYAIEQTKNKDFLEVIAKIKPLQNIDIADEKTPEFLALKAIVNNQYTNEQTLKNIFLLNSKTLNKIIVSNPAIGCEFQKEFLNYDYLLERLAINKNLCEDIFIPLLENQNLRAILLQNYHFTQDLFQFLIQNRNYLKNIARNIFLKDEQFEQLLSLNQKDVLISLAKNLNIPKNILQTLSKNKDLDIIKEVLKHPNNKSAKEWLNYSDEFNLIIASNPNTPKNILEELSKTKTIDILIAISKNPNTPVAILEQLWLDMRLKRYVTQNSAFTEKIGQDIGWM